MTNSMKPNTLPSVLTYDDVKAVSPALEQDHSSVDYESDPPRLA
jgi:hypothetical protein